MGRPPSMTLEQFDPQLADQLVDQSLRGIAKGSATKVEWRCARYPDTHTWFANVYNRTNTKNKTGCPICIGKVVLPGFNDVATTDPEVAAFFVDKGLATQVTKNSNKKFQFHCGNTEHEPWTAPVSRLTTQGSRCPQCSGRRVVRGGNDLATTHPRLAKELADPSLANKVKANSGKVVWKCVADSQHGTWEATVRSRAVLGTGCPRCSGRIITPGVNDFATTHPELAKQLVEPKIATTFGRGYDKPVTWQCAKDPGHQWLANPANRVKGVGCPICDNKKILAGFNDMATTRPDIAAKLVDPQQATTVSSGSAQVLTWQCTIDKEHVWLASAYRMSSKNPTGCPECYKKRQSAPQIELLEFVKSILPGETIETGNRKLLGNGQELDIVIPSKKIAIEFNGVYWHSEAVISDKDYHYTKSKRASDKDYRLIHVWEDDWINRKSIIKAAIAHRLDVSLGQKVGRFYARDLEVFTPDPTLAREFFTKNHLQGPVGSTRYYALRDNNGITRAVLGAGRTNHGSRSQPQNGVWDVQRYATNSIVVGGFSKLLSHATELLRAEGFIVDTWTSYSNDDMSDGGMYKATGFVVSKRQAPSYWYVGALTGWKRAHRTNYVKQRFVTDNALLYKNGWTEHQAAMANGLYRIYDAGKTKWIKCL